MSQKTLIESIKELIINKKLSQHFTSNDLLSLKNTGLLKRFEESSLQTFPANSSLSHKTAGDLGIGIPVSRGLQKPFFWRMKKVGKSLVFALISEAEKPLADSIVSEHRKFKDAAVSKELASRSSDLLTAEQAEVVRAAALVLKMEPRAFVKKAIDNLLDGYGLPPLPPE